MKRTERHRLKENELAVTVARARDWYEEHHRQLVAGAVAIIVAVVAAVGYLLWRQHVQSESHTMLATAMAIERAPVVPPPPPPAPGAAPAATPVTPAGSYPSEQARTQAAIAKYVALADAYPSTEPGLAARYYAASDLAQLGRNKEAMQRYQEVVDRAGSGSLYGEMARLGLAETQARMGQFAPAISTFKSLAASNPKQLPVDGLLMQLARTYAAAGRSKEAQQTYQRIVDEFPTSAYASLAKRELDTLKVPVSG